MPTTVRLPAEPDERRDYGSMSEARSTDGAGLWHAFGLSLGTALLVTMVGAASATGAVFYVDLTNGCKHGPPCHVQIGRRDEVTAVSMSSSVNRSASSALLPIGGSAVAPAYASAWVAPDSYSIL
jgi:hypothetical protein